MKTTSWLRRRAGAITVALAVFGGLAPAAAQEDRDDCRCVDRDGNPIENCHCFREPRIVWRTALTPNRARLGITLDSDRRGRAATDGVRISSVLEDGPADHAGLREGDVIVSLDGHSLLEPLDRDLEEGFDLDRSVPNQRLMALVRDIDPGDEVDVVYLRDGDRRTATIRAEEIDPWRSVRVLGSGWDSGAFSERMRDLRDRLSDRMEVWEQPRSSGTLLYSTPGRAQSFRFEPDEGGAVRTLWRSMGLGLDLTEMQPGLASYFGVDHGVLVTAVDDDSELGLEAGDVILSIHGRDVETPTQVRRILGSYRDDEAVSIRVMRQKRETTVEGTVGR